METPTPKKKRGRPAKAKPTPPTEPNGNYVIEVFLAGTTIKNSGDTMLEALKGLERPTKIITKGTVKVFHGDNTKELFFMPLQLKRMFYPLAQVTIAKMLAMNI